MYFHSMIESSLHTTRLTLQLISNSDLQFIHELLSHAQTDRYNALGIPESLEDTISMVAPWINENQKETILNHKWVVEDVTNDQKIGLFELRLSNDKYNRGEVWYKNHPNQWHKGYATEVLNRVLDFGFDDYNLHRIQAGCAFENIASRDVLEKIGMIKEGRRKKIPSLKSGWSDNFEYSILESDPRKK